MREIVTGVVRNSTTKLWNDGKTVSSVFIDFENLGDDDDEQEFSVSVQGFINLFGDRFADLSRIVGKEARVTIEVQE